MKCPNCGGNMEGNTCPYCDTHLEPSEKKKEDSREYKPFNYADSDYQYTVEKWYMKTWVIILFLIFFFPVGLFLMWRYKEWGKVTKIVITVIIALMAIWGWFSPDTPREEASPTSPVQTAASAKQEVKKEEPAAEAYESDYSAGIYTAGIDFPAGTYTLAAVSGSGNVSSSNMFSGGLNEVMSNPKDEYSIDSFDHAVLKKGVELSIGGTAVIRLSSPEADVTAQKPRATVPEEAVDLGSGNFAAGTDFPAGVYNVIGTGGNGNVSSSNLYDGGINEIMGPGGDGFGIHEFKNVSLPEGTTLTVSSTTIQLVPVR